jgi:hypothetical protein
MSFFQHGNLGQPKRVFAGIVDDPRRVVYSQYNRKQVGAAPEQSDVRTSSGILRDLLSLNNITRRFRTCEELQNTACAISQ